MTDNVFNPIEQEKDLASKITAGLERIAEVYKVLLWDKAKNFGISPIQIQLLIFTAYHPEEHCNVSNLAQEFNVTKATISDAIRVLNEKEFISKAYSSTDRRRYNIQLTPTGQQLVQETQDFANPIRNEISEFPAIEQKAFFDTLSRLIYQLNQRGILSVQRTCYACKFYSKTTQGHYCTLLEQDLSASQIRLDCPEFLEKLV